MLTATATGLEGMQVANHPVASQPASWRAGQRASLPASQQASKPTKQAGSHPAGHLIGWLASEPAGRQASLAIQLEGRQTNRLASPQAGQPAQFAGREADKGGRRGWQDGGLLRGQASPRAGLQTSQRLASQEAARQPSRQQGR